MQPFPIPYEPTNLTPCLTLRSRREVNHVDATNARLVEHWQTDAPTMTNRMRNVNKDDWWEDTNAIPSRLYRESLAQSQPYVIPGISIKEQDQARAQANRDIKISEDRIASLEKDLAKAMKPALGQVKPALGQVKPALGQVKPATGPVKSMLVYGYQQEIAKEKTKLTSLKEGKLQTEEKKTDLLLLQKIQSLEAAVAAERNTEKRWVIEKDLLAAKGKYKDFQDKQQGSQLEKNIQQVLTEMQILRQQERVNKDPMMVTQIQSEYAMKQQIYQGYLEQQRLEKVNALAANPYFAKYDVAGDSRNIIRELRGVVSEDVVDRGVRESKRMMAREMQSRWLPEGWAEDTSMDTLGAYDIMRPKATRTGNE